MPCRKWSGRAVRFLWVDYSMILISTPFRLTCLQEVPGFARQIGVRTVDSGPPPLGRTLFRLVETGKPCSSGLHIHQHFRSRPSGVHPRHHQWENCLDDLLLCVHTRPARISFAHTRIRIYALALAHFFNVPGPSHRRPPNMPFVSLLGALPTSAVCTMGTSTSHGDAIRPRPIEPFARTQSNLSKILAIIPSTR
ncbi:hypothetical protein C8J57DRAFT_161317 [Mycena rebaudengoi]|nr:hypothetical protein C8J57DRAFT_161317 [Mycena rebaudengoi]